MRVDLDSGMDHDAALDRANGRKRVGRKHNHQPRGRSRQRIIDRKKRRAAELLAQRHKMNARIAAYWRGEINGHPLA